MERHILLLLISTSLVTAQFIVTRHEKADNFIWIGATFDCNTFTDGTATWYGDDGCECNSGWTFSTENNQCVSYVNEGTVNRKGKQAWRCSSNVIAMACTNVIII